MKRQIFRVFCLSYPIFPAIRVHVELCDWLDFVEVTSSGHFSYLSAGRSRLTTFTRDQAIEGVSTSSHLSCLVRRAVQPAPFKMVPLSHTPFRVQPSPPDSVFLWAPPIRACNAAPWTPTLWTHQHVTWAPPYSSTVPPSFSHPSVHGFPHKHLI